MRGETRLPAAPSLESLLAQLETASTADEQVLLLKHLSEQLRSGAYYGQEVEVARRVLPLVEADRPASVRTWAYHVLGAVSGALLIEPEVFDHAFVERPLRMLEQKDPEQAGGSPRGLATKRAPAL